MDQTQPEIFMIDLSLCKSGTQILIETNNSFYEITLTEDHKTEIVGGSTYDGHVRYPQNTRVSVYGLKEYLLGYFNCIYVGCKMFVTHGSDYIITSKVRKISVQLA